jgi:hypothetical protein
VFGKTLVRGPFVLILAASAAATQAVLSRRANKAARRHTRWLHLACLHCALAWCGWCAQAGADPAGCGPQDVENYYSQQGALSSALVNYTNTSPNMEVIVNSSLYSSGQISAGLNQYLSDLRIQGYNPTLTATTFADAAALRSYLGSRYSASGLAGAVIIGDEPIAYFERANDYGEYGYARFPCDLYYTDFDGAWSDSDSNGTFDTHAGNVAPEIWLGRLTASNLTSLHTGRTEASLLNSYFQKDHAYRQKQLALPQKALAYIDDDWIPWASSWGNAAGYSVGGQLDLVQTGSVTIASDYKNRLSPSQTAGYESVLLAAHSSPALHEFKIGSDWTGGYLWNSEIQAWDPKAMFYNLFCCSNARFDTSGYMGGEYVFGTDYGLVAIGSAKTGSMLDFDYYYDPLGQGATVGEAFESWWQAEAQGLEDQTTREDWFYGMTVIGDPTLRTQAYPVPEPSTLWLLTAAVAAGLVTRHWRR